MKTAETKAEKAAEALKNFNSVKFVREQRDRLDAMFAKMTKEEAIAYLNDVDKRYSMSA